MKKRKFVVFSCIFSIILNFSAVSAEEKMLVPSGKSIGVILSTDGVMVVGVTDIETPDGEIASPAKRAGIKAGDLIQSVNGSEVSSVSELSRAVEQTNGEEASLTVKRKERLVETLISPKKSKEDGKLKIGAWVKDAASGIGTMTFYNPSDGSFAALGHGICDSNTGDILKVDGGSILSSTIVSVQKGEKGAPGELKGVFSENKNVIGEIKSNNLCGIFGNTEGDEFLKENAVPVAEREEIHEGKAHILANVEGNIVEKFDVEIVHVMPNAASTQKGMVIKVTDKRLIDKTGGIVQGM